jgi:single-stranded DNA-binding protein
MAIKVEFEGWVNDRAVFDWGTVLKVTHDQRAKNAAGEWETVGKDYIDVTVTPDQARAVASAKVVKVSGSLKVGTYDKRDGSKGVSLKVRATDVAPVERGFKADPVSVVKSVLAPESEELPF